MAPHLYVATRKGLFTVAPAGTHRWGITRVAFLGDHVSMVLPDGRDGSVYSALDHGHFGVKLHRSRDGGETWEELPAPAFPKQPEGETDQDGFGRPLAWKLVKIWSLEAGLATQPGVLWCGSIPGGLFRSGDGGASWELVRSLWDHPGRKQWFGGGADLPGIHSISVDPRDGRRVTAGVSCGGVWLTEDGGETWRCRADGMRAAYMPPERAHDPGIQDPHRVVHCPDRPDCLWAQHHNGIFRSTDGAASWQEIDDVRPSAFGFAAAVHPHDPEVAWFVPATKDERRVPVHGQIVVLRTRNGGESFAILRNGLPQEHAYDITYRHGLDVDGSGDRLTPSTRAVALLVVRPAMLVPIPLPICWAYLLKGDRSILVDTGRPQDLAALERALHGHGVAPADLSLILHTHGHWDHAGSTAALRQLTPARVAVHAADAPMMRRGDNGVLRPTGLTGWLFKPLLDRSYPRTEPDLLIEDELDLSGFGVEARVVLTPGHTTGSISVLTRDGEILIGDLLMGGWFGGWLGPHRPGLHYYAEDLATLRESVRKVLALGPRRIYPAHGGPLEPADVARWLGV
jgi:glyoxylase-like metal-dependent hydrolase (beta-lactamase superfamily II)